MDISHETEFKNLNEKFLEPNLAIESISQMNQEQQLEMKKIQSEIDKLGRSTTLSRHATFFFSLFPLSRHLKKWRESGIFK